MDDAVDLADLTESQRVRYRRCRANGCAPGLARVLATRRFPGVKGTDRAFLEGRQHGHGLPADAHPDVVARYHRDAARAGVNTAGRVYVGTIARFPGDPEAWVADTHDVRRVVEGRGWACRGAVEVAATEPAEDPAPAGPYRVDPRLVDCEARAIVAADPTAGPFEAVREQVAEVRAGAAGRG